MPYLTTEQMVEVDWAMIEDSRIELIQMMENAGRNLVHLARRWFLNGDPVDKRVVVLAGTGGNGGGALVAARCLHNWGVDIHVFITRTPDRFTPIPRYQLDILKRMRVPVATADRITDEQVPKLIVDGVIGYNLKGAPAGAAAMLIEWANAQEAPALVLDAPSGVDTTTETVYEPAVRADQQPPADSPPLMKRLAYRFPTQDNRSLRFVRTYVLQAETPRHVSFPSRDRWVSYSEAKPVILDDAELFLKSGQFESLWVDVVDHPFENGVVGRLVIFNFVEQADIEIPRSDYLPPPPEYRQPPAGYERLYPPPEG